VLEAGLPVQRRVVNSLSGKGLLRLWQRSMLAQGTGVIVEPEARFYAALGNLQAIRDPGGSSHELEMAVRVPRFRPQRQRRRPGRRGDHRRRIRQDRLCTGGQRADAAVGFLLKGVDFKDLAINMGTAQTPVLIKYGAFLQTLIDFTIIVLVLFLVIKGIITLKKRFEKAEAAAPPKPTPSELYLKEIRDALVKK
jgi:large conductance mechanosensitive channel protein